MGKITDEASIRKSIESLNDADKVKTLIAKLVESEKKMGEYREKAIQADKLTKVKENLEKKLDKANQVLLRTEESKSKLEELCRGLQKLNQQVREENMAKVKKLESERQEAVIQLKTTLKEIEMSMNAGREKSDSLAEDNKKLAEKFNELSKEYEERIKTVAEQYEKKEKYWEEYAKTKDIEVKLLKAKLEASSINLQKMDLEKQELAKHVIEETARVGGAIETEKILRQQVKEYADKYAELSACISKSNTAFDKFRKDIDRVNANCRKYEAEIGQWKKKNDEANQKVLVLTMSNKEYSENIELQKKKIEKLENLCRALRKNADTANPSTTD